MAEDLVKRLRDDRNGNYSLLRQESADLIEQQAASLAAKDKEIERLQAMCAPETDHPTRNVGLLYQQARAEQAERALAEAVEVMRPLASAADDICEQSRDDQHIWEAPCAMNITRGHLRAARAFVAQHGSDSSTER